MTALRRFLEAPGRLLRIGRSPVVHVVRAKQTSSRWLWALCGAHDLLECARRSNLIPGDARLCKLCRKAQERGAT